jgi:hypothetical protein
MDGNDRLGRFEEVVLLALLRFPENAYGVPIRREIAERTGRDVSFGAVYTTLERLERKGCRPGWANQRRSGEVERSGIFGLRRPWFSCSEVPKAKGLPQSIRRAQLRPSIRHCEAIDLPLPDPDEDQHGVLRL